MTPRFKVGVSIALLLALSCGSGSIAQEAKSDQDEYQFRWLDPDKKINVLQNRRYIKENQQMFSLLAGPGSSNPYRNTWQLSARIAHFFSEWVGVEFFYTGVLNQTNDTFEQLRNATANVIPVVREVRYQVGGQVLWMPWYAKINVFNTIIYFDWYFGAGAALVGTQVDTRTNASSASSYVTQKFGALVLSTGHLFHFSDHFGARLDVSSAFYRAPRLGTSGDASTVSNFLYGLGVSYRL